MVDLSLALTDVVRDGSQVQCPKVPPFSKASPEHLEVKVTRRDAGFLQELVDSLRDFRIAGHHVVSAGFASFHREHEIKRRDVLEPRGQALYRPLPLVEHGRKLWYDLKARLADRSLNELPHGAGCWRPSGLGRAIGCGPTMGRRDSTRWTSRRSEQTRAPHRPAASANLATPCVSSGPKQNPLIHLREAPRGEVFWSARLPPTARANGLNLVESPTIVWFETDYSVYTMRQASRRSWRIGQSQPVQVVFMAYRGTLQAGARQLVAKKLQSSLAVEGELPEDGLAAYGNDGDDLMLALARKIVSGEEDADSVESVFAEAQQVAADAEALLVDTEWRSVTANTGGQCNTITNRGGVGWPG